MGNILNWPKILLGDIAEFRNGINFDKKSFGEGIKIIGVADFQDFIKPRYSELNQINPVGVVKEKDILKDQDVVFVRSNGNRELIGRSLYIENPPDHITHSAFTIRLRFNKSSANSKFFAYLFKSKMIREALTTYGGGTNISNLNQEILRKLDVPFPPLRTQQKIAAILSAYDDLIENNLRRIKILEEMAQNFYREWFVNFRFPGHEKARFVDSPLGRIPAGWEVVCLSDIATVIPGYAFKSKDWAEKGVPVIKIKNIKPNNIIDTQNVDRIPKEKSALIHTKYWLTKGSILVAMTGATAGKVGKLRGNKAMLLNQRVAKIEPKQGFYEYVWLNISAPDAERKLYALADGAAQPNMSGSQIENLQICLPPTKIIMKFNDLAFSLINNVDNMILLNDNLRQTRDLLLPKLISGEVDVSELDISVPEEAAS